MILTEGGMGIGFGHIARCISLSEAFEERGVVSTMCINGDDTVHDLLDESKYRALKWNGSEQGLSELIKNFNIVVVDSYLAQQVVYEDVSRLTSCAVYLDDDMRIEYPRGVVVNGSICSEELPYPPKDNVTLMLGSRYMLLRKEFWSVPKKEVREGIDTILITFGGDDVRDMTPTVLELLVNQFPKIKKKVIIGRAFQNVNRIEEMMDLATELIYYPSVKELKNTMINSDIAVSAAGQTLGELARVGVPTVALGIAHNQINNIKGWSSVGCIEFAGWYDDPCLQEKLLSCIRALSPKDVRGTRSSLGQSFVDGMGSFRIVDHVLNKVRHWERKQ